MLNNSKLFFFLTVFFAGLPGAYAMEKLLPAIESFIPTKKQLDEYTKLITTRQAEFGSISGVRQTQLCHNLIKSHKNQKKQISAKL